MKESDSKFRARARAEPREGNILKSRSNSRAKIQIDKLDSELMTRVLGAADLVNESLNDFEG
jgi:hypothetical protein